ncbi:MAG: hypothetical protein GY812_03975 [Actinomycetia bacterium]|nr:hypothetical protein [Actinomycetes bacterium]
MSRRSEPETWADAPEDRIRVLLECDPASSPSIIGPMIERRGFEVRTCEGPDSVPCDLLTSGACPLVDGADVVVNIIRERETAIELVNAVTAIRRPPAVLAQVKRVRAERDGRCPDDRNDVIEISPHVNSDQLVEAIGTAVERNRQPIPIGADRFC